MTEKQVKIIVDKTSLEQYKNGNIFGVIYFEINEKCFPSHNWTDFVVPFLIWWTYHLHELWESSVTSGDIHFMDGPYSIRTNTIKNKNTWEFSFYEYDKQVLKTKVSYAFVINFLLTVEEILTHCHKQKWTSRDINKLEELFEQLKGIVAN